MAMQMLQPNTKETTINMQWEYHGNIQRSGGGVIKIILAPSQGELRELEDGESEDC